MHDISPLQQQTIAECLHSCHTCRWEYNGSWHPTSQLAVQQGLTSSPLWLRLWVVWRRTPSRSSEALVTSSVSVLDRAHPVLPHAANNFFTVWQSPCGAGMPACGCIASPPYPPQWTVLCSVCVCVCVVKFVMFKK